MIDQVAYYEPTKFLTMELTSCYSSGPGFESDSGQTSVTGNSLDIDLPIGDVNSIIKKYSLKIWNEY